jgi:hypothetical protein
MVAVIDELVEFSMRKKCLEVSKWRLIDSCIY